MFKTMQELVAAFPTLRNAEGVNPWDVDQFLIWALTRHRGGGGAAHAIRFCLNVYNPSCDWAGYVLTGSAFASLASDIRREVAGNCRSEQEIEQEARKQLLLIEPFNLGKALGVWDAFHVEVLREYLEDPYAVKA